MNRQLLMAVDLGTSFIKCGVYDTESICVEEAMEPVKDERPSPGVFIQRGDDLFASVVNCIKVVSEKLGERAQDIAAIAFTGQMSGFMGVGTGRILPHGPVPWIPGICHMQKGRWRN